MSFDVTEMLLRAGCAAASAPPSNPRTLAAVGACRVSRVCRGDIRPRARAPARTRPCACACARLSPAHPARPAPARPGNVLGSSPLCTDGCTPCTAHARAPSSPIPSPERNRGRGQSMPPNTWNRFTATQHRRAFTSHPWGRGAASVVRRLLEAMRKLLAGEGASSAAASRRTRTARWPDHDIEQPSADRWEPRRRSHG